MERCIRSLPYTAPQPMGGYDRVLGSRLRRNGERRKQMIIVRRNFVNTNDANENELRLRRFQRRYKDIGELG